MRPAIAYFWIFPILILAGASALAVAFFLRYRKAIRHYFLTILAVGLYFGVYLLMVFETTLPRPMPGVRATTALVVLAAYSIVAWDAPVSFAYALNRALTRRAAAAVAVLASLPFGAGLAFLVLPLDFPVKAERLYEVVDAAAIPVGASVLLAAILAALSVRGSSRLHALAKAAFAASAPAFLALGLVGRYALFAGSFPQRELSFATALVAWDILATALAAGFGPGERQEAGTVAVPDAFLREAGITAREAEALELLATGASYKDISLGLGVSLPAVKKRISSVYRKSGAANRVELVNILLEYARADRAGGADRCPAPK